MRKIIILMVLSLSLIVSTVCTGGGDQTAQQPKLRTSSDVVNVQTVPTTVTANPGSRISFEVKIDIREHWHLYAHEDTAFIGIDLVPEESFPLERTRMEYPAGTVGEFFGEPTVMLAGKQTVKVWALVPESLAAGDHDLGLFLTVQACDDKRCLAPSDLPVNLKLKVE